MFKRLLLLLAPVALVGVVVAAVTTGADHRDGPVVDRDPSIDLADVFAFVSPADSSRVVFAMTVHGFTPPGDIGQQTFNPNASYEFKVDASGDAVADAAVKFRFSAPAANGSQTVTAKLATGAAADGFGDDGSMVAQGPTTPPSGSAAPGILEAGGLKLFVGPRDDAFFFDQVAFVNNLSFRNPGSNLYTGFNVSTIVLEMPLSQLSQIAGGATTIRAWAAVGVNGQQVERAEIPGLNALLVPAAAKDEFNRTKPAEDPGKFRSAVVSIVNKLGGNGEMVANLVVPAVVTIDTTKPLVFPNGRRPQDDVVDAVLKLVTGNQAASDNVNENDVPFLNTFPYFAAPHQSKAITVTPNGDVWELGLNGVVIQGTGSAAEVTNAIRGDNGQREQLQKKVISIFVLRSGVYTYYLPGFRNIDGGLASVSGNVSAIVVLDMSTSPIPLP